MPTLYNSRPAFDLEGHSPSAASIETHPLSRQTLHHSASLPNIWFPPHSGPIPQGFNQPIRLNRPPTPPSPRPEMSPPPPPSIVKAMSSGPRKPLAAIDSRRAHNAGQNSGSGRRNKKTRMSYITPPLTPSSSIATAASVDSSSSIDATEGEEEYFCDSDKTSSRFLALGAFRNDVSEAALEVTLFESLGQADLDDMTSLPHSTALNDKVKVLDDRQGSGEVLLAFYDLRLARIAHRHLSSLDSGSPIASLTSRPQEETAALSIRYLGTDEVLKISAFANVGEMDGGFYVTAIPDQHPRGSGNASAVNVRALKNYLRSFGDLQSYTFVREHLENKIILKTFHVEFYNAKDAAATYESVSNQKIFGMALSVYGRSSARQPPQVWIPSRSHVSEGEHGKKEPKADTMTIYSSRNERFSAASQFTGSTGPTNFNPLPGPVQCAPQWEGELRTEHRVLCANPDRNCDYCPSRRTPHSHVPFHIPPTPSPPTSMCSPIPHMVIAPPPMPPQAMDYNYPPSMPMYGYPQWAFDKPIANLPPTPLPGPPTVVPFSPPMPYWHADEAARMQLSNPFNVLPNGMECHFPGSNGMPLPPLQLPPTPPSTDAHTYVHPHHSSSSIVVESFGRLTLQQNGVQIYSTTSTGDVATKNQLVIGRIESGQDTRTTAMIKNIPNKMSDRDLIAYINKVCPRRIDFLYLRMDFRNSCNVGYAFVNFIEAQDLLKFAKSRLGERWNMFSSEKVIQMSYANYQGKEALVEKFKNSCIMDEREAWRPKIFYSFGPNQGLPEPFPAPTHIRRKERSSFNRGALYVPGLHTRNTLNSPLSSNRDVSSGSNYRGSRKGARASGPAA